MPTDHDCPNKEIIETIRTRLGTGDVTLAVINGKLESQDEKLERILEQTTKTNGRVTKLEQDRLKPRMNAAAAVTVITCTSVVCGSALSLIFQILEKF